MKTVLTLLGLVAAAVAIFFIREATITREVHTEPGTAMEVVLRIHTNRDRASPDRLADALFGVCQLQVAARPVGERQQQGDATFAFTLSPTLDESDRRQLEGCLEDARIDHIQGDVLSLRQVR